MIFSLPFNEIFSEASLLPTFTIDNTLLPALFFTTLQIHPFLSAVFVSSIEISESRFFSFKSDKTSFLILATEFNLIIVPFPFVKAINSFPYSFFTKLMSSIIIVPPLFKYDCKAFNSSLVTKGVLYTATTSQFLLFCFLMIFSVTNPNGIPSKFKPSYKR